MDIEHTYDTHITQEIEHKKKYDQEKEEKEKRSGDIFLFHRKITFISNVLFVLALPLTQ